MKYYQVTIDEELKQVKKAIDYYYAWADEFNTRKLNNAEFINYYYRGLDTKNLASFNFRALFFAMRLQPALTYITRFVGEQGRAPYILDLGCGFGLESVLMALCGAKVWGVDPTDSMIRYARVHQDYYQEKHGITLDLHYDVGNIFTFRPPEQFDAVYSSATLHHIEPVDRAFQCISALIKPQGYFFLSDENGYSPAQQLIVQKRIGWTSPRTLEKVDPNTGETYIYGNENIRPPFQWAKLMKAVQLEPVSIKYCRFLPPVKRSIEQLVASERFLRTKPVLAEMGAIGFMLVSQKSGG